MFLNLVIVSLVAFSCKKINADPIVPPVLTASGNLGVGENSLPAGGNFLSSLLDLTRAKGAFGSPEDTEEPLESYPYEEAPIYGAVNVAAPPPPPAFGVSINTKGILAPQVEVLRLIEAFLKLKGEILARVYALYTDNADLVRGVIGLVFKKLSNLHAFSLKGVSVLRKILEFALNLFSDWTFTLPAVTFGAGAGPYPSPHQTYGVPELAASVFESK